MNLEQQIKLALDCGEGLVIQDTSDETFIIIGGAGKDEYGKIS